MKRIALIRAKWQSDLVGQAVTACRATLSESGIDVAGSVDEMEVPGSLEIPLVAKRLAETGQYGAVLCFGLVINSGIYRHDFVAGSVIDGIVRAGLDTGVPVLSCVLTPHNFHEHEVHRAFFSEHLVVKGREIAESALEVMTLMQKIGASPNREVAVG